MSDRAPEHKGNPMGHELRGRIVSWVGSLLTIIGGVVGATNTKPPPPPAGQVVAAPTNVVQNTTGAAGIGMAIVGLATIFLPGWWRDRKDAREDRERREIRELQRQDWEGKIKAAETEAARVRAEMEAIKSRVATNHETSKAATVAAATADAKGESALALLNEHGFLSNSNVPGGRVLDVLIVEDEPHAARALTSHLTLEGFHVQVAPTVSEALRALSTGVPRRADSKASPDQIEPWDCVILDLVMMDGEGEDVLRCIRRDKHPPRAIVTTAVADPERLERAWQLLTGQDDALLVKPIELDELMHKLRRPSGTGPWRPPHKPTGTGPPRPSPPGLAPGPGDVKIIE